MKKNNKKIIEENFPERKFFVFGKWGENNIKKCDNSNIKFWENLNKEKNLIFCQIENGIKSLTHKKLKKN